MQDENNEDILTNTSDANVGPGWQEKIKYRNPLQIFILIRREKM